jgi:hypothetical protein
MLNLKNTIQTLLNMKNRKEKRYIVNTGTDYGAISDLKIEGGRNW